MYKAVLWIVCLLLVSTGAMAAPRALARDGSLVGGLKQTSVPSAHQLKRSDMFSMPALANENLAPRIAPTQPHGKTSAVVARIVRHAEFGAAPRNIAAFSAKAISAYLKPVQNQPTAPPVVDYRSLPPSQA